MAGLERSFVLFAPVDGLVDEGVVVDKGKA